jgi:hypothetical protein
LDEACQGCIITKELDKKGVMMKGRKGRSKIGTVLDIVFWLIAVMLILGPGAGCSPAPSTTMPKEAVPEVVAPPVPASTSVTVGENVTLDDGNQASKIVVVAVTKTDLDELTKLSVAGDNLGFAKVIADGHAFMVDKGTKAKVIDQGMYVRQVRIMSGDYYGESGWVPMEFCKK